MKNLQKYNFNLEIIRPYQRNVPRIKKALTFPQVLVVLRSLKDLNLGPSD